MHGLNDPRRHRLEKNKEEGDYKVGDDTIKAKVGGKLWMRNEACVEDETGNMHMGGP